MIEQDVNGVPHVLVPKEAWEIVSEVFSKLDKMGEQKMNSYCPFQRHCINEVDIS